MKPVTITVFAISLLVLLAHVCGLPAQDSDSQVDQRAPDRLVVGKDDSAPALIELQGFVRTRNKYSIVVENDQQQNLVNVSGDTRVILKLASPRFFFDRQQLTIGVEGIQKQFRGFEFRTPLYLRAEFAHRNQFQRIMAMQVKRISNYVLSNRRPVQPENTEGFFIVGEVSPGPTNRQLKLKTEDTVHDVVLARKGRLTGFSIADLVAGETGVRIKGSTDGRRIDAVEILFWPIAAVDVDQDGS